MKPYEIINRGYKQWEINNRETGFGLAYSNCTKDEAEKKYLQRHPEMRGVRHSHHMKTPQPRIED